MKEEGEKSVAKHKTQNGIANTFVFRFPALFLCIEPTENI